MVSPIADFTLRRLTEKREHLIAGGERLTLTDHAFVSSALVSMFEILSEHMDVTGRGEKPACTCGRGYPCHTTKALAWVFHDHVDYDETWDPNTK